jgi:hypothetical protein
MGNIMARTRFWLLAGALALSLNSTILHAEPQHSSSALSGTKLRYKIGTDNPGKGRHGEIVEVGYDWGKPLPAGLTIAYCNMFNEKYSEQTERQRAEYGPYLRTSDTAREYGEGQIDPRGQGWRRNLVEQFERRKRQGFEYIELDNPDAYSVADVVAAIDLAASYGLKVIAKNPKLMQTDPLPYIAHPNVYGIIVEKDAGDAHDIHALRERAGKPDLPVWFVFFDERKGQDAGKKAAKHAAGLAQRYASMHVTYSPGGEYIDAIDEMPAPSSEVKDGRLARAAASGKQTQVRIADNFATRKPASPTQ